jgi:predicted esterase YcpF (UPF0227 family)
MILFIHGFGSCGWGRKSLALRRFFGVEQVIAPDLPFRPATAVAWLRALCRRHPIQALVGSSLGGFYATGLNLLQPLPTVLVNPVIRPDRLLSAHLGPQRRWCDDARFTVDQGYVEELAGMQRAAPGEPERYLVLLQTGDEVLDYRQAADFYRDKDVIHIDGGSHRFERFEQQLPAIAAWLHRYTQHHVEESQTTA